MTAEIDPLEAVIKLAKADTALNTVTGGRIDNRHHYGQDAGDWAQNAQSLVMFPAGGLPDLYLERQRIQLDVRCYGDTYFEAGQVLAKLTDFTRQDHRRTVTTSAGKALVYFVILRGQPRQFLDMDVRPLVGTPAYQVILEALVAEQVVI